MKHPKDNKDSLVLKPGEGRVYKCGIMTAVFKAASLLIGEQWIRADKGTFIRIPAKTMHDFKNQTNERTGLLNFFIP